MRVENLISLIFHPSVSTALGFIIIYLIRCKNLPDLLISLIFFSFTPFLITLILMRRGRVSDLLVTRREQRGRVITLSILGYLIAIALIYIYGINLLFYVALLYTLNSFFILLITLKYKISIHVAALSGVSTVLLFLVSKYFVIMYFVTALVAWARVKAKEHELSQVVSAYVFFALLTYLEINFISTDFHI